MHRFVFLSLLSVVTPLLPSCLTMQTTFPFPLAIKQASKETNKKTASQHLSFMCNGEKLTAQFQFQWALEKTVFMWLPLRQLPQPRGQVWSYPYYAFMGTLGLVNQLGRVENGMSKMVLSPDICKQTEKQISVMCL